MRIRCLRCLCFDLNVNKVSVYICCICCLHMWYSPKWRHCRGDELLNKVVIFVFFVHKKYSRIFVKLRLNHWCHMDYFNDLLAMFLSLDHVRILAVYKRALGIHQKYLNLCSEDEWRSYGFETTWRWVTNDRIFIFGWTIPLMES